MALQDELAALLQQFQPTADDRENARRQAILQAGFGLLGTRKGQELPAFGQAGLLGMQAQHDYLQNAQQQRMQGLQAASMGMGVLEKQRQFADQDQTRKVLAGMAAQQQQPSSLPPASAMSSLSPTPSNAAALTSWRASQTKPQGGGLYEQLLAKADALEKAGLIGPAQEYRVQAEKYAPQYDGTETLMQGGKPVVVQKYKNRPAEALPGFQPKPDYKEVDNGQAKFFYDPMSGAVVGNFQKQATPGEVMSNLVAQGNLKVAQGHLGIAQSAEKRAAENEGRQTINTDNQGNFYAINPRTATGTLVTGPGGQPLNKGEKALTESQAKALVYMNQMISASQQLSKIEEDGFSGAGKGQQIEAAMAGTSGLPYSPVGPVLRALSGEKARRYDQAQKQWTEGFLRFQSGATITPAELEQGIKTYFPQVGDGPDVIAQKKAARTVAENNMKAAAGSGAAHALPQPSVAQAGGLSPQARALLDKYAPVPQ